MKVSIALNALFFTALVSASALGPRQATNPTLPAGAGPKCTNAPGQNPQNLAGKGLGTQFATGCCLSDKDCQTACCGKLTGICQNLGVAVSAAVGGCGGVFGTGAAAPAPVNAPPAAASSAPAAANGAPIAASGTLPANAGPKCVNADGQNPGGLAGARKGTQFITGCCTSDQDCASACCGKLTGVCQAPAAALAANIGGCGGTF